MHFRIRNGSKMKQVDGEASCSLLLCYYSHAFRGSIVVGSDIVALTRCIALLQLRNSG